MTSNFSRPVVACIMAGGTGTRFWPLSTDSKPKQFLRLFSERTLLQQSYDRMIQLVPPDHILVLTNEAFVRLVKEQLPDIPNENIIAEPMRRDTAAAIALAAFLCNKKFENPVMLVVTSDHIIHPTELFTKAMQFAIQYAINENRLCTFGIVPEYPATGFGYLQAGEKHTANDNISYFPLLKFHEKPDYKTAENYLASGMFYWNSGMFVWQTATILQQISRFLPQHFALLQNAMASYGTPQWPQQLRQSFSELTSVSIDISVMQKVADLCTGIVAQFYWNDVGGWLALEQYLAHDECRNAYQGHIATVNSNHNIIFSDDPEETIALIGMDNFVVVRAGSNTLIAPKDQLEKIKELVAKIRKK